MLQCQLLANLASSLQPELLKENYTFYPSVSSQNDSNFTYDNIEPKEIPWSNVGNYMINDKQSTPSVNYI